MAMIDAVQLRGGPCDGETPEPLPGTAIPDGLDAITVWDHGTGVGHVYAITDHRVIGEDGTWRSVFEFRRTVARCA